MQKPPLHALSPGIESLRRDAITLLQPLPLWSTAASERLSLRQQIERELRSSVAEVPKAIAAQALSEPAQSFDNYYLRSYGEDAAGSLSRAMLPVQRRVMDEAVREVFRTASDGDLQRLLAVIDPDVRSLLPASMQAARPLFAQTALADKALAHDLPALPADARLSLDEFLALVNYLHPYTCHYQVINGDLRLSRYWGVDGIAEASALLREPYLRALHKLQRSGLFSDRTGRYAKGIVANGHSRRLSQTLDFLVDRSGRVIPPHPVSATRCANQSFALQPRRPEDTTLFLKVPEGIDVTPFHGSLGKALREVILLPQPLQLCLQDELPSRAAPHSGKAYLLEAVEPRFKKRSS